MGEEKKEKINSFVREVAAKVLGYGLAIVLASLVLASFPSCSAKPEGIEAVIPGLDSGSTIMPGEGEGTTAPPVDSEEPAISYVDIPTGYKIDANGDYSKLIYPEELEIVNGRMLYFKDSTGKSLFIRSSGTCSASSPDDPHAIFTEKDITLKLRDLTLVFIKK